MTAQLKPSERPCKEYSGERILARSVDYSGVYLKQIDNGIFGRKSRIFTMVCINCGTITSYAENPRKLLTNRVIKPFYFVK